MAAAMASETGTVGFVGGMDIPLIRAFQCGYEQGVMAVNSSATVLSNMTGTTPAAWNDPAKFRAYAKPNRPWCGRCISGSWRNRRW